MRARVPDVAGTAVASDGVRLHYEVHGAAHRDGPTVFLLPTWPALDARIWKLQVPYLARHLRVLVADPRGNGRSDRPAGPDAYTDTRLVEDAVAVLDATATDAAVCVGLSMGGHVLMQLAAACPDRVDGAVFVAPSLQVEDLAPACWRPDFEEPYGGPAGFGRYSAEYWRTDVADFARWFFGEVFSEPHSTKLVDDTVEWTLQTDAETLIDIERAPYRDWTPARCPALVITGDDDRIVDVTISRAVADALGCPLEVVVGGGHAVNARHPVWFNHRLLRFVQQVSGEVSAGARA